MVSVFLRLALLVLTWQAASSHAAQPDWLLEADVSPQQTPVQTQATYRLRFFQGVDIRDVKFTAPSVPLADVRPINNGRIYEMQREGRRYRVHEYLYAIFPFAAGELKITGAYVVGHLPQNRAGNELHVDAAEQNLRVIPPPLGHSLAAASVVLSEKWEAPAADEIRTGQTLRRQILIEATGIDAGQIPELPLEVPGMSVHAEPAQLKNHFHNDLNVATRTQTFNLAPLRTGEINIPELNVRWWNLSSGATSSATLPPRKLRVAGDAMDSAVDAATPPKDQHLTAIILAGILCLISGLLWRHRTRLRLAWRLERALHSGDPIAIRDGILAWAQHAWTESTQPTLGRLAEAFHDPSARQAAENLDRLIYGPRTGDYTPKQLTRLARQIKQGFREREKRGNSPATKAKSPE